MSVKSSIESIKSKLPDSVTLVTVSKTQPLDKLMEAYETGQRIFGENKIQEMSDKQKQMPKDVEWHMIGHVQTNKVKDMASFVTLIHGVESLKLLQEIDKQALKNNRTIDCLLQVHIAEEESKFGMTENELNILLRSDIYNSLKNIKVKGLMGMATFTDNQEKIRKEFSFLKNLFLKKQKDFPDFEILSMGMSDDYKIAIECGSTMVRIGSRIFGERN